MYISRFIPDSIYLRIKYYQIFGEKLNLRNPATFTEKMQWIKLYDRRPIYTTMVDKYDVKKYVADIIGEEHIIPTLGVWERFEDIDFNELPDKFVLKCTHDSGGIYICKGRDDFDYDIAKDIMKKHLARNYYLLGREWPYKNVSPRIIAEEYIETTDGTDLKDYKFFCFGGKVKCYKIDFDRFVNHRANYFDLDNNRLPFGEKRCPPDSGKKLEIPKDIDIMEKYSEMLSRDIPFLRVDFYYTEGKILFGELTFFPDSGFGAFTDTEWNKILGEWIPLPV